MRTWRVLGAIASIAALSLTASASQAGAAVTIGQVGDSSDSNCTANFDWLQHSISSGSSYVIPGTGTIISWTTFGGPAQRQLTMKIFRRIDDTTYQVVGHDGPRTVTTGGTAGNTFPANVSVKPGDTLGFHVLSDSQQCAMGADPGDQYRAESGNLADGQQGTLSGPVSGFKLNIQADFVYDNTFTRGKVKRNKNKGTATVTLNIPNPGELTGSGGGAKVAAGAVTSKAVAAGQASLVIRAKGKKKRKLNDTGKVKVKPMITYTPTGGDPGTQVLKVKLKKKI